MSGDAWNFDVDEDGGGEESDMQGNVASRDCVVMLVDASKSMFTPVDGADKSPFALSMEAVYSFMCKRCASGDGDHIGIVFINTKQADNALGFEHIWVLQGAKVPGAEEVKALDRLMDEESALKAAGELFGGSGECGWDEALWLANAVLTTGDVIFGTKRVMLFTNCDAPHAGNTAQLKRLRQKVSDLSEQGGVVDVVPLGQTFDGTKFWKGALGREVELSHGANTMDELMDDIRRKEAKKRSQGHIPFSLGGGVEMAVNIYNLVSQAKIPTAVNLSRTRNEEVVPVTSYFNEETGEKYMDRDLQKVQTYAGQDIAFDFEEVETMRRLTPTGLVLLGFKPKQCVKVQHHIRPSVFVFPDEKTVGGSTKLFRALLNRCAVRNLVAICRMTARRNMPPRLVALIPEPEPEEGESREDRDCPPGFHAVFLPWADDLRDLSAVLSVERAKADEKSVEAAKGVVKAMKMKGFDPDNFLNPALQAHYAAVEAMALDREELHPFKDDTEPNCELIAKKAGPAFEAFKAAALPQGYEPGKKRAKTTGGGTAAKKEPVDLATAHAANSLGKLTVAVLKESAGLQGIVLPEKGKKLELIEAIQAHFNA